MDTSSKNVTGIMVRGIKIVLRLLSVPLLMVIGIASGYGIAKLLDEVVIDWIEIDRRTFYGGVAVFGATVVLSTLQDLFKNIPDFFTYVFTQEGDSGITPFMKSFSSILLASFGLMISFHGLKEIKSLLQLNVLNVKLEFSETYHYPALGPEKPLLVSYILYARNADSNSLNNNKDDTSVWPDPYIHEKQIANIVEALISCGKGAENPVEIQIRGFASSNQWESAEGEQIEKIIAKYPKLSPGEAFNLHIANQRAKNVESLIKKVPGSRNNILIKDVAWENYTKMKNEMFFEDVDPNTYLDTRGFLTRRVEIRVLKAPGCVIKKFESN
jgi:hypothetical protein